MKISMKVSRAVMLIGLFTLTILAAANEAVFIDFNTVETDSPLSIENWRVVHPFASQTTDALTRSSVREVQSRMFGTIMGVRIYFPPELMRFTTQATIQPRAENSFNSLQVDGGLRLRSVSVNVNSLYLPPGLTLSITLKINDRDTLVIPMGDLRFEGWREMTWVNPFYAQEVENNTGFYDAVSFQNFIVHNASDHSGDTIFYIRDVIVSYDTRSSTQ